MIGTKILEERKSKYNGNLKVCRSLGMGTYIQAEGLTQSGGIVESIWKSTLRHLHARYDLQSTLILGLGGGTVAKLIRKKYSNAKITGIDIDPVMIELGKKYLHLDDYKVKIIIGDVSNFSNLPKQQFDLVIVDLYQGDKFPEKFETDAFINMARTLLADNGTIVFNRLYYGEKRPEAVKFGNRLTKVFSKVDWFYPEANLMFICS
jgi:spermidine synthase